MNENKEKMSILEIILRFLLGFLLPFVLINGIILYLFIQVPNISIIGEDSDEYEVSKIKFRVESILPITSVKTFHEDTEIAYTKLNDIYTIDAEAVGSYQINASIINGAKSQVIATLEAKDIAPPAIDFDNAVITNNMLIFTIFDNESEINYDSIYGLDDDGNRLSPIYIDKSSGTIQFQVNPGKRITVHVEDVEGNSIETAFVANE
ncbi:MAG: hypothetical protein J6O09_00850 [Lachnospiraceae bacterium]|nr:hypothetical protein [Lachnospiraceae bacterium]